MWEIYCPMGWDNLLCYIFSSLFTLHKVLRWIFMTALPKDKSNPDIFSVATAPIHCLVKLRKHILLIFLHVWLLKLVSAIFYQIFIFPSNDGPSKTEKCFLFHLKSSFHSHDFVIFSLPFHTSQVQKGKWKWNNLLCHKLACINLQM